ncbi:hypothetical protein SCUCBS95973_003160 [Sporothrix curviconia]|uniref:Zn(2)-C6 fungal-type domain-containing protein n=1 Tax=Sporothrix curviconia TaxID=1260050 RepID=A0ABP0BE24_9PEZI
MSMPTPPSPAASALALREFFGDRKPPEISRKITACVACRKLKIKCHMPDSKPPCTRCKRRDLSCTVNHSLQMLLENDVTWKRTIEQKLQLMQEQISKITDANQTAATAATTDTLGGSSTTAVDDKTPPPQPAWEVVMDPKLNPGALPASCIAQVEGASPSPSSLDRLDDLIARGAITLATAEHCFATYKTKLDSHVYDILTDHDSLAGIRVGSPLLTAAVCAVGALHSSGWHTATYAVCHDEFLKEYTSRIASRHHPLDDVRALCIGAFWLSDLSWMLSGTAVRIAVELNLHRGVSKARHACINKTAADRRSCYLRTRLYLLVYVCDHHFSIAYGRAPLTREFTALIAPRAFLEIAHESEAPTSSPSSATAAALAPEPYERDVRLVSQVELWSVLSRVFDTFGVNTDLPMLTPLLPEFRRASLALESWRIDAGERLAGLSHTDLDAGLHFSFAKLYLCTHAFRGVSTSPTDIVPPEMEEFADGAVYAARSLLRSFVTSPGLQVQLEHMPTYCTTMVAAAVVFLFKMTIRRPSNIRIDTADTTTLLGQMADVLTAVAADIHPQNVLAHIAASIDKLLGRVNQTLTTVAAAPDTIQVGSTGPRFSTPPRALDNEDLTWLQDGDFAIDWFEFDQVLHNTQ